MLQKPNLSKPQIGGDLDDWGRILNETIDTLDSFNSKIVEDSSNQDQEIARLDRDKINQSDIDTVVQITVDNYMDTTAKPNLNNHVETVNKPELDRYTEAKKSEVNTFTEEQKVELNQHEKVKETEITSFVEGKKTELVEYVDTVSKVEINSHTDKKKVEINTFTEEQKVELDVHEKNKEKELDAYEKTKEAQLDTYVETVSKVALNTHTDTKKNEINSFTEEQKVELNTHEKEKETELDNYNTSVKKPELDAYEKVKETEITAHTNKEITRSTQEISDKSILEQLEIRKKGQEELDKLATAGLDGLTNRVDSLETNKQDKTDTSLITSDKTIVGAINELNPLAKDVPNKVDKAIQVIAGKGLIGGGDLGSNITLNIASADEGVIVNDNDIKLNIVDDLVTGGVKRPLSAEQGKVLDDIKLDKTAKAIDSDKLDGNDSTYFAKQSDLNTTNTQVEQNKSDILLKFDKGDVLYYMSAEDIEKVLEILYPTKKMTICSVSKNDLNQNTNLDYSQNMDKKYWIKSIKTSKNDTIEQTNLNYIEVKYENNSL